jgi:16S rRNA (guanine527-N7)-methyltransferase
LTEQFEIRFLYHDWNEKINVISRKDIDFYTQTYTTFVGIAKVMKSVFRHLCLDVGTGGGFPGIPLIFQKRFYLIDVICKKKKSGSRCG